MFYVELSADQAKPAINSIAQRNPMGSKKILNVICIAYTLKKLQILLYFAVEENKETKFSFQQ